MTPINKKIVLVNAPHQAIGSRMPKEHLPPLGLLSIGGPLIDAGFEVELLDAEFGPMPIPDIITWVTQRQPAIVMMGHSGSTTAHTVIMQIAAAIKAVMPTTWMVVGGVFPTYHWQDILSTSPQVDVIVRGEGEHTTVQLAQALLAGAPLHTVDGIAYRQNGVALASAPAELIQHLDDYRVGWELIDHRRYSYWGNQRAVVVQFSRGCPHQCSYCGQRGFWTQWRHRDPIKFARELARLHREQGVTLINFADELPTGSRKAWKAFLEALIAENVNLTLVGSTRADHIVRDADLLPLYKKAGVIRFLLGIETYNEATLKRINKGTTVSADKAAIQLLRQHGIIAMATYVVGFEEETDIDYWRSLRHLLRYDPDQIQMLFVTPHRWTPYFAQVADRTVIQTDTAKWDYKHQVLATAKVPPWRVMLWVKTLEVIMQTRPKALFRLLFSTDPAVRHGMRWYTRIGRRVWFHEIFEYLFRNRFSNEGRSLKDFWGAAPHRDEVVNAVKKPAKAA